MFEAARVGDQIQHTSALAGFLVGAIFGAALIFAVAMLTFSCPFLVGFIAGFLASMIADKIVDLATSFGRIFASPTGTIAAGSSNVFVNGRQAVPAQIGASQCERDTPHESVACGSSTVLINGHVAARILTLEHRNGRVVQVDRVDGARRTLARYDYDDHDQLVCVYDRAGEPVRRFAYTGGLMTKHVNALGFACDYRYARYGDAWRVIEHATASGERYVFEYDLDARRASVVSEEQHAMCLHYDEHHLVTLWTDYLGARYRFEYDRHQRLARAESPGERVQRFSYDDLGRLTEVVDALGRSRRSTYHLKTLKLASDTLPDGSVWQWKYTEHGLPVQRIDPLRQVATFEYDRRGLLTRHADERGGTSTFDYDDRYGLPLSHTDCSGSTTRFAWNGEGELVRQTDALGQPTQLLRNASGAVHTLVRADGTRETFEYNALGQIRQHTNALGHVSRWRYTSRGQPERYIDRLGRSLDYRYDTRGRLCGLTNANGATYRFAHDATGRLTTEIRLNGVQRQLRYNEHGEVVAQTLSGHAGEIAMTGFVHDAAGRLVEKRSRCSSTRYRYDLLDRVVEIARQPTASGLALGIAPSTLAFEYDALGRLVAETADGLRTELRHDALGNVIERRLPFGQRLSMLHYGSGHVHQIGLDGMTLSDIERDALHREVRHTQGPRQCHTSYDPLGRTRARLSELTGQHGVAGAQMLGATYEYDLAGNVRQVTRRGNRPHERSVLQYTYDVMGRMTGCHDDDGRYERYAYDAADNLIDATRDATASKVLNDLLTRFRDTGYTYDGFGQLCRKTQDGMVQDFVYDDEGRMVRASGQSRNGFHSTRYAYDAIGRRTGKITSRTEERVSGGRAGRRPSVIPKLITTGRCTARPPPTTIRCSSSIPLTQSQETPPQHKKNTAHAQRTGPKISPNTQPHPTAPKINLPPHPTHQTPLPHPPPPNTFSSPTPLIRALRSRTRRSCSEQPQTPAPQANCASKPLVQSLK